MSHPDKVSSPRDYVNALTADDRTEGTWLQDRISAFWEATETGEYDCVGGFSLCRQDLTDEVDVADDVSATRCCGTHDEVWGPSPAGHTYLYAFDYGH
jgi:hypothetical protein